MLRSLGFGGKSWHNQAEALPARKKNIPSIGRSLARRVGLDIKTEEEEEEEEEEEGVGRRWETKCRDPARTGDMPSIRRSLDVKGCPGDRDHHQEKKL